MSGVHRQTFPKTNKSLIHSLIDVLRRVFLVVVLRSGNMRGREGRGEGRGGKGMKLVAFTGQNDGDWTIVSSQLAVV